MLFYRDLKPIFDDGLSGHLDFMALLLAFLLSSERLISGMPSLGFTLLSSPVWGNISTIRRVDGVFVKLAALGIGKMVFGTVS